MQGYDDKRGFRRVPIDTPAVANLIDGRQVHGRCIDISASGLSLIMPDTIACGESLVVEVASAGGIPPLEAEVRVLRCEEPGVEVKDADHYHWGCVIDKVR
ncbi:PilZ domain-containing protein [Idiomarina xiamenensis]|uniref:PilZ domain-containing protein n=1 Tax=Idiomarina xiamenensis 10-D-4 TaxID=740709 RepID=K2JMK2_9GAMM|nr:PilZ domain-containing protein [Idiomarina xiamenensis]EKE84746.1 hypothetical protein A10D4_04010 [Idiomarina xiamenensis 10-D-4]